MTPARGGLIDLLVPDERDRRAIDETLADWRADADSARHLADRARAHASVCVALARTFAGLAWSHSCRPAAWYWCWKVLLLAGALAFGTSWLVAGRFPFTQAVVGPSLEFLVLGTAFSAFAPIVVASGAGRPCGDSRPLLGVMIGLFVTIATLTLLAYEAALRSTVHGFVLVSRPGSHAGLIFGASDAPALLLFAEALRRRLSPVFSRRALNFVAAMAAAVLSFGPGLASIALGVNVPIVSPFGRPGPIVTLAMVLAATWWLSRNQTESRA
jgi:hypothetical protein